MKTNNKSDPDRNDWCRAILQRWPRVWLVATLIALLSVLSVLSASQTAWAQEPNDSPLELFKQADVTQVAPGGMIEYSITILNGGRADATNITMLDPIPTGTTFVVGSESATAGVVAYDAGGNQIKWNGDIPGGGSVTIRFKVQVGDQIDCQAEIRNRAVLIDADGKELRAAIAIVKINCPGQPILDIRKTANLSTVAPGGEIEYTIVIANGGTGPAIGVVMYDPIPTGTTFVPGSESATAPTVVYNGGANRIEWTGNIPAGGSVTIKFKVRVGDQVPCDGVIRNRAGILLANGVPGASAETATPIECPRPKLEIRKSADVSATLPGGQIEWTIVVANTGSGPANGVVVHDPIPAGTTFVAGSESATLPTVVYNGGANRIEWTGNIPAGGSVTIKFKVTVGANFQCDNPVSNRAALVGATGELAAVEAKVWVGCPDQPIITIGKRADVTSVAPGGFIQYTIVVANAGSVGATGVTMIDPIPAGTTFVAGSESATAPTVTYNIGLNRIEWTGNIAAGGNVVITFQVQVNADHPCDGVIENRAGIERAAGSAPLIAAVSVKVECGKPELTVQKRVDLAQTPAGGVLEYTIVIANTGTGPALGVTMIDPIPAGTTFVAASESATLPTVAYDGVNNWVKWNGDIPAGGNVTIKFKVTVSLDAPCQSQIENRASVLFDGVKFTAGAATLVTCEQTTKFPDFGDAPDSDSNHSGLANTAYLGPVLGHFPSVWDNTPATEPSGPNHAQANQYWLGDRVTRETDADLLPDADPETNILNNGTADVADRDRADDGWLNPNVPLLDCRVSVLKVRISRALIPPPVQRLYLNVWFDGNRDGDWNDVAKCPQLQAQSFEWIVQNWWIDPTTIPAGGFLDVAVPTLLVHNAKPEADVWLRFSLSEQKAVLDPALSRADGRGPAFPSAFRLGETEDYYRKGETQGQPGEIKIEKLADPAGPVNLGDVITYRVLVHHVGGSAPAFTTMTDLLPVGVTLISGPFVTEITPSAAPLVAAFNPGMGPNGAVLWAGTLSPNATVQIAFRVRVRECVNPVRNLATATNTNGTLVEAKTETAVNCEPHVPGITLEKSVLVHNATTPVTDAEILPGDTAVYYLTLSASDGLSHTVHISDSLPSGLIAVATSVSDGVANIINAGHTVIWDGIVGPANSPVTIKILVRIEQKLECDQRLENIAHWFSAGFSGQSNPVILRFTCRDLGDAPDSTNHFNVKMAAYPAVQANYPTVFDVAAPERGPRHERPRPFHLGQGVTAEVEADQGFDTDGVNNIKPPADQADQDKRDDGLLLSTLALKHCQIGTMRVQVSIDAAALALLPNGVGYLNAWVDSNRDGDWADRFECPQSATGAPATALEHIVIDLPVNAAALGAGVHILNVSTSVPVFWPADQAQKPAWLRLTLSERVSNKPFVQYGDGRGYDVPFRLGETEDYLVRLDHPQGSADPVVTKHGEIWPDFDPQTQQRQWVAGWIVNYANLGSAPATNVHVIDTFDPPQTLLAEHSIPLVPHTQTGNTLDYNVGTLPVGGSGLVIVRTAIPFNTPPGTVLRNLATVSSNNDSNALNNSSVATVTVPILAPIITAPLAGTTCTNTVSVTGQAQPGVTIDLYVDNVLQSSLPTDGSGNWSTSLNLAAGSHDLHAIAHLGALVSPPSPTVTIIVDPTLFWDPISLRFVDELGHVIIPSGRLDESGWSLFLRPGHTYTVSLHICCTDPNAAVTMELGDDIALTLTDPDDDHIFTATFTIALGGRFTGVVRVCVTCDLIQRCSDGTVLIDPEGTVFDVLTGQPIDGANVACLQAGVSTGSSEPTFSLWPALDFGQVNPQSVATDGYFSFFTPQGTFRVNVAKSGYQPYESPDLVVVDTPVHHDVPLTPIISAVTGQQIAITESGFEPAVVTVAPGTVIEWINTGESEHSSTRDSAASAATVNAAGDWDSGLLQTGEAYKVQLNAAGTYTYQDSANPEATATIIVSEPPVTVLKLYLPVVAR